MVGFRKPGQGRSEYRPDRSRIGRTIGVSADLAIDRAGVETAATANAAQNVLGRCTQQFRASVVEQHDMEGLGAIKVALAPAENVV